MARTDPLNAALLLSHPHHHHHHHKAVPTPTPAQTAFHIGSFHHHISGDSIGYGLGVIIVIAVIAVVVRILRS